MYQLPIFHTLKHEYIHYEQVTETQKAFGTTFYFP